MLCAIIFLFFVPKNDVAANDSIQAKIDAAKDGDVILLQEGIYEENIIIDKSITLLAEGDVSIVAAEEAPVVTITANHVTIENLAIEQEVKTEDKIPAIAVTSDYNTLSHLHITSENGFGVHLDKANENKLEALKITGKKEVPITARYHGIDVWKSNGNHITDTQVQYVLDGVYMEDSNDTKLEKNKVSFSRYGYHLMFTKKTQLQDNIASNNISGLYIMGADGTVASHNVLKNNQANIQSLGLLLFDTVNATIRENDIIHNRIGMLIENAEENNLTLNQIQGNYIGVQFIDSKDNHIEENNFIANVVQGQAENSADNQIDKNYWGDHLGLDLDGSGYSNLPYEMNPFFLTITDTYPPFQLLFQSPGLVFLEQLIALDAEEQLIDNTPMLQTISTTEDIDDKQSHFVLLISILAFMTSILIIYMGVKKQ